MNARRIKGRSLMSLRTIKRLGDRKIKLKGANCDEKGSY